MERKLMIENLIDDNGIGYNNVRMLALASASMVIQECVCWEIDIKDIPYPPRETVLGGLNSEFIWPRFTLVIALEHHVEIVYGFVKFTVDNFNNKAFPDCSWIDEKEANFFMTALEIYQKWKTAIIKHRRVGESEVWGRPAGSHTAVWDENNKTLLKLCKEREL